MWSFQLCFSKNITGWEELFTSVLGSGAQGSDKVQVCYGESTLNRLGIHLIGQVDPGLSLKGLFNFSTLNMVGSNKC